MTAPPGCVFLLSDYGQRDEFAGVLRAVVAREAPGATIVDLTHDVPMFDVRAGALVLERCVASLGRGVVLAVVDPGVGTSRRAVAVAVAAAGPSGRPAPSFLVGPDNGLLGWALARLGGAVAAVELTQPPGSSATFDGRDVFAPAAAALWRGRPLDSLGRAVDPAELAALTRPLVERGQDWVRAEVLAVDRFGNVELAAAADATPSGPGPHIALAGGRSHPVRRVRTFAELAAGEVGLIVDSAGHLALVCDRASAATVLGVQPTDVVTVRGAAP